MKKWNLLAMVLFLSALFGLAVIAPAYSAGTWKDLGTLGGRNSTAYGINDSGQIVGDSYTAVGSLNTRAFLYSENEMKDLGGLPVEEGYTRESTARGINNSGQIVGHSYTNWKDESGEIMGAYHAFLYEEGVMKDKGTPPWATQSFAFGINDLGQIVGQADSTAFLYSEGVWTDLGHLGGGYSCAKAINNNGHIVGWSTIASGKRHAFLWTPEGKMQDLGTLYGIYSEATGINDSDQIVGFVLKFNPDTLENDQRACLYEGGVWTDLVTQAGTWGSGFANGINKFGKIVGYWRFQAFLYSGGQMTFVLQGASWSNAYGINNNAQIVGAASLPAGDRHAFLYTPEPPAGLSVNPTSLSPSCVKGRNAASQSFTVQNTGGGTLSYTITKNAAWLSVTPASGTSTGEQDTITVNYATSGLAPGKHNATITISAPGATGSPKTIGVPLTVKPPSSASMLLLLD
jgi:probable HAF family extracellular repeat protein